MYVHLARAIFSIQRSFREVLTHRRPVPLRIRMKQKQSFRKISIIQSFGAQQGSYHLLVTSLGTQRKRPLPVYLFALFIQHSKESKTLHLLKKCHFKSGCRLIIIRVYKSEKVFEHTTGSTRCRNKFRDLLIPLQVSRPRLQVLFLLLLIHLQQSILDRSRPHDAQKWKTNSEIIQLGFEPRE